MQRNKTFKFFEGKDKDTYQTNYKKLECAPVFNVLIQFYDSYANEEDEKLSGLAIFKDLKYNGN